MTSSDGFWGAFSNQMYGGTRIPRISGIVGSLWEAFDLQPGCAVADICCGRGYSSIELALRGAEVHAVDFTEEFIESLNTAGSALHLDIVARHGNAADVSIQEPVCAAMILWNSLGHQNSETDIRILANASRATHPGGWLALELATLEELSKEPYRVVNRVIRESTFRRTRNLDVRNGVLSALWEIFDKYGNRVRHGQFKQRVYPKAEILRMMKASGWLYVTDSDNAPMNCEPTGTLFIGRGGSNSKGVSCMKCRTVP